MRRKRTYAILLAGCLFATWAAAQAPKEPGADEPASSAWGTHLDVQRRMVPSWASCAHSKPTMRLEPQITWIAIGRNPKSKNLPCSSGGF